MQDTAVNADVFRQNDIISTGPQTRPGAALARGDKQAAGLQDSGAPTTDQVASSIFNPIREPLVEEAKPEQASGSGIDTFQEAMGALKAGRNETQGVDAEQIDRFAGNVDS